jgi:2-iminobutanoate/2-iminopropanoate deaminase
MHFLQVTVISYNENMIIICKSTSNLIKGENEMKMLYKELISKFLVSFLILTGTTMYLASGSFAAEPGMVTHVNEAIAKQYAAYGVSEAVRAGDFLYIGGIVAFADDGSVLAPNDGKVQLEVIYKRIKQLLKANSATAKNVVSETLYVTDWSRFLDGAAARLNFYDEIGAAYPTAVAFEVRSLAAPGLVVEVQVVAYLGSKK